MLRRIAGRIYEFFSTSSNAIVSRVRLSTRRHTLWSKPSRTWNRPDYLYWDDAYSCRVRGLEVSGLFIKPVVSKMVTWSLGRSPSWVHPDPGMEEALNGWWSDNHDEVMRAYRSSKKRGDSFVVINPDMSMAIVKADAVDPIVAVDDYSRITGWRVSQVMVHPEDNSSRMFITDEYYQDRRIRRVTFPNLSVWEEVFPNLIGILPIVHIPNKPEDGEVFGRPEAESILPTLHRYGEVLDAAIEGNITQGRPTPHLNFENQSDLDAFWSLYGSRDTYSLPDGSREHVSSLSIDLSQVLTTSGAGFEYKSPSPFMQDTERILVLLFYLILEHVELPEFVMGNAIASSKASAETQMPVFERFIEGEQTDITNWLVQISKVVIAYFSLSMPGSSAEDPVIQWKKLTQDGRLTLDTLRWAYAEGLIDRRTALILSPVEIADVDAVLDAAEEEIEERTPEAFRNEFSLDADVDEQIGSFEQEDQDGVQ